MQFDANEDFIKNSKRLYSKVLLQTDAEINYPEARPIGEILAQIGRSTAEDDGKILAGPSLNDEDDANSTLESLKQAESAYDKKMDQPLVSKQFFKNTGSLVQNMMGDDPRIYTKMLNLEGELDEEKETRSAHRVDQANKMKQHKDMEAKNAENKKDLESMAIHFQDQGFSEDDMM